VTDRGGPALALCGSNVGGDRPFSCALRLPDGIHVAQSPPGQRGDLATLADGLCRAHGVRPADLRELRLDLGPGSYTGLRVAVTFARFLQRFGRIPTLACDSLLLIANAVANAPPGARLRPLLDARRERFHCGTVRKDAAGLHHEVPPVALPLDQMLQSLQPDDVVATTTQLAARLAPAVHAAGATVAMFGPIDAGALFATVLPLRACEPAELEPHYLMGSYAED
jgi:tRNA threonylcarbamoyladenosine biosynthesis protein TsaB